MKRQNRLEALSNFVKGLVIVVIILTIAYFIFDALGYTELMSKLPPEEEVEVFESSGIEIFYPIEAFRTIENSMYSGKKSMTIGTVDSVFASNNSPHLTIESKIDPPASSTIEILLANPDDDLLSNLNKGDRIFIEGVFDGDYNNLIISHATIKKY